LYWSLQGHLPLPGPFSYIPYSSTTAAERKIQRRRSSPPFSSAHQGTRVDSIVDQYSLATESNEATKRLAPQLPDRDASTVPKLQPTAVDKQELPAQVPELQPTAVAQVCKLPRQARTSIHQYCLYSNCSRSSLQAPTTIFSQASSPIPCGRYTASNPILCVANQAHHPYYFALPSEPTTASQLSPVCFQQQHSPQPLASLALQSNLKTIF